MFRSFQGWMSLSNTQPGGGTLRLCPLVKHSISYVMLRPLLKDVLDERYGKYSPVLERKIKIILTFTWLFLVA